MAPALSVFTAAHESGELIERPWRSLLAQTTADWEWVVVDDSSGPETSERLDRFADSPEAQRRVRVERRESAGVIGASKAQAAAACRGRILVELDHDDELLPDALDAVADAFASYPDVDFVHSDWLDRTPTGPGFFPPGWGFGFGAYATDVVGGRRVPVTLAPPITWETIRHIVAAPNHLRAWRASFYREIGGHDPELPVADDYELIVRTFLEGRMARIPRPLYVQHHDPEGRTASRARNAEIQERVAEIAAKHMRDLDARCLALGAVPARGEPLTSADPLAAASDTVVEEGLVSVVVPTCERPEQLGRAIASVLAQTHTGLEVLVVGDACPEVDAVIAGFDDPRVRHWNLERRHADSGAAPRNYALKAMARGSLVAYLDDDNTWSPEHLETLVASFDENRRLGFAFSSYTALGEEIVCREPRRFQIDTSALLHRRELLERHGYWRPPIGNDIAHDWELVSRWRDESWAATRRATLAYTLEDSATGRAVLAAMRDVADQAAAADRI